MKPLGENFSRFGADFDIRRLPIAIAGQVAIAVTYFAVAKLGLALASIHPNATPIWPPTGFALAAVLLWGYRVWPAIFIAALVTNETTAGSLATSAAIAAGNTLEGLVGGYLINHWSGGRDTFETPARVAKFALISAGPATIISATVGVVSLSLGGFAPWANFASIWMTWWLGDLAGALVIAPVMVLWVAASPLALDRQEIKGTATILAVTVLVALIAFGPLLDHTAYTAPLGFLAILPLMWAALRRGQRDTATVALILSTFAVWGTLANGGPFARASLNESFLLLLMFMISTSLPSLALSADVAVRKRTEENLRQAHDELDQRVQVRTAALGQTSLALQIEGEQRRRAEAELEQERVHLLEAQRLANLGSWIWDVAQGKVTWSQQLYEIYGIEPGDFGGTVDDFLGRIHPDDRDWVKARIGEALQSGYGFRLDERIVRPDGEIRYLQSTGEVITDEHGKAVRLLGVCHDVTENRETLAALERAREQLAQAQKMEALGQLTGGIAHDFNNLLMIVNGQAELLRRRVSDPKQTRALEAIQIAASRGAGLTRQLLAFSRRQRLNPVVIDLRERIAAVRDMLVSSLRGDITLICDIPDEVWPIEVDPGELDLTLLNIAVNARDAMPHGGTITLTAGNVTLRPGADASTLDGDFVALAISDTGTGIPTEVRPKIFEPFFTTKEVGKGTGLGLSQVYGFAHQSGGAVTAASEVGRGTTNTIHLPRSRTQLQTPVQPADAKAAAPATGTILIVEDNGEVAEVTAALLDQLGYRVVSTQTAAEALQRLEDNEDIDLVFSDIVMPGDMNGLALAQEILNRYPLVPVLLTTGYSDMVQAAATEFALVRKPFELKQLDKAIREALRQRAA